MSKRCNSKFKRWFIAQFGNRASSQSLDYLDNEMTKAHYAYNRETIIYDKCLAWDRKFDDCLKAWCATTNRKVKK